MPPAVATALWAHWAGTTRHDMPPAGLPDGASSPKHTSGKGYIGLGMSAPPADSPQRQDLQQGRRPGPLQDQVSHCEHQDLESPAHWLRKTTINLPENQHHNP